MTQAERTQACPSCGRAVTMVPYDIGSGPEMSCPHCEWCWGADGQPLRELEVVACLRAGHHVGVDSPSAHTAEQCPTLHLSGPNAQLAAVRKLIEEARAISPSGSMSVYVSDLERALGDDVARAHKLGQDGD